MLQVRQSLESNDLNKLAQAIETAVALRGDDAANELLNEAKSIIDTLESAKAAAAADADDDQRRSVTDEQGTVREERPADTDTGGKDAET